MTALVAGHPLPALLAAGVDPGVVAWRRTLPGLVDELLARWELEAAAPFEPGGSSAWVAPVRDADGAERVLKVAWAHEEARDEARGMEAWQGRGAARVHRWERRGETSALLLERVRPGTPLTGMANPQERDEIIAAVARRLWRPPRELVGGAAADGFRPLSQMCAWWADEAQGRAEAGLSPLPAELVELGLHLFRDLPRRWDGEPVLLATDLHAGNLLAAHGRELIPHGPAAADDEAAAPGAVEDRTARRWVLIDPKPYVGDPHYDLLQHMLNDPDRLRAQPGGFADRMAELGGLDPGRLRRWLLARCVQEAGRLPGAADAALSLAEAGVA